MGSKGRLTFTSTLKLPFSGNIVALPFITDAMKEVAKINAPKEVDPAAARMVRMMEQPLQGVINNLFGVMFKQPGQGQQGQGAQPTQSGLPPGWEYSTGEKK